MYIIHASYRNDSGSFKTNASTCLCILTLLPTTVEEETASALRNIIMKNPRPMVAAAEMILV